MQQLHCRKKLELQDSLQETLFDDEQKEKTLLQLLLNAFRTPQVFVEVLILCFVLFQVNRILLQDEQMMELSLLSFNSRSSTVDSLDSRKQHYDQGLLWESLEIFGGRYMLEYGARDAHYGMELTQAFRTMNIRWYGFDPLQDIETISNGAVEHASLSDLKDRSFPFTFDVIFCQDIRSHFSTELDSDFIQLALRHNVKDILLTGVDESIQNTILRSGQYVIYQKWTDRLRKASSSLQNKDSITLFRRKK